MIPIDKALRAAGIAALLLVPACDDDDNGSGPAVTLQVTGSFTGEGGEVLVTDGGVGVTGAVVTLNGTAATGGTDGEYTATLGAPVAPGGELTLEVTDGGAMVLGTATVPATPALTGPAQDAVFAATQGIEVTWTSATDPDRWVVEASDGTVERFDVADGAARAFTIPGGALAADTWEIRVIAHEDGVVSGDLEAGSAMEVSAAVASSPTVFVVEPVRVQTLAFTGAGGSIAITQGGVAVDGATVEVNGQAAVQPAPGENYQVTLAAPVAAGGLIALELDFGVVHVEGTATVPEAPVVTAPADGALIPWIEDIDVAWTSTADASAGWVAAVYDPGYLFYVSTTNPAARTLVIPGGFVNPGGPYQVTVHAVNAGELTGPVSLTSTMNVRSENVVKPSITVTP